MKNNDFYHLRINHISKYLKILCIFCLCEIMFNVRDHINQSVYVDILRQTGGLI